MTQTPISSQRATLRITADLAPATIMVCLEGELDVACADPLEALTSIDLAGVERITVDLAALELVDSIGREVMVAVQEHVPQSPNTP